MYRLKYTGLQLWAAKIKGFENLSLWQRLNFLSFFLSNRILKYQELRPHVAKIYRE